ncbi:MAG: LysR family transcriptional regulator [Acidobacteriaceae bacterium]|nr:LysR family transcriptional regulator [Acidobacteriaceae bacterium]
MAEYITITLKRAAVVLADELDYPRAAEKLNISCAELREQISALEAQLCLHIFTSRERGIELTEEGQILIRAFREAAVSHHRIVQ